MKIAFAVITVLALAACSQTPPGGTGLASATAQAARESTSDATAGSSVAPPLPASTATAPAADAASMLTQYHWRLANAVDKSGRRIDTLFARAGRPLQLDFDAHGVSVGNTCNRMHGSYSIAGDKLTFGTLASTMMARNDPALAALDAVAGKILQGTFTLALDVHGKQPTLTLSATGGEALGFIGTPTDATRYGSEGDTVFLEVAPQARPCPAPSDSQCLYVRDLHFGANGLRAGQPGDWHVLAQGIKGYKHQAGTRDVLRVKRYKVTNPPAGAASIGYVLDMVVETGAPHSS